MNGDNAKTSKVEPLRRRAKAALRRKGGRASGPVPGKDVQALVQTLQARQAEFELLNEQLLNLVGGSPDGIFAFDRQCRYTLWNPGMAALSGLSSEAVLGRPAIDVFPFLKENGTIRCWLGALAGRSIVSKERGFTVPQTGRSGFYVGVYSPVRSGSGEVVGGIGIVHDTTARRRTEEQLRTLNESLKRRVAERTVEAERQAAELRRLAAALTLAEQHERRRLAASWHDDVAQILSLARIKLAGVRREAAAEGDVRRVREIEQLTDRAIRSARSVMLRLSHPALYDLGFVAAAEWLARDIGELYGLEVKVHDDGRPKPMDQPVSVILFQCLREALANAAKHSRAKRAWVRVGRQNGVVRVTVGDRGVGFDPASNDVNAGRRGFGLFSIRERLADLGGRMRIRSAPGRGATVTLEVPAAPTRPKTGTAP